MHFNYAEFLHAAATWESQTVITEPQDPTELKRGNDGALHLSGERVHSSLVLQLLPEHLRTPALADVNGLKDVWGIFTCHIASRGTTADRRAPVDLFMAPEVQKDGPLCFSSGQTRTPRRCLFCDFASTRFPAESRSHQ